MQKLPVPQMGRPSEPASAKPSLPSRASTTLPPVTNRATDVDLPRQLWSSWQEDGKPRQLRRALTADERAALEGRRDELAPALEPFADRDVNRVALAVTDMFDGFPQMRSSEEGAVARVDRVRHLLAGYPAWAIEKACRMIQQRGTWRDGKFDRRWPPSDAELVLEVKEQLRLYGDTHRIVVALLEATVEERQR